MLSLYPSSEEALLSQGDIPMPLVKRNNSKYWYVQFQIDHQTVVKSTKTTDKKAAQQIEARMRSEFHAGRMLGIKKSISFGETIDRFIETKEGRPNYKNLCSHRKFLFKHFRTGDPLRILDSEKLAKLSMAMTKQGYSPQTIKHRMNLIMGSIRMARRDGYETLDVFPPVIKLPTGKNRFLSKEEERRLLNELDPNRQPSEFWNATAQSIDRRRTHQDNYDLVVLLLDTGARYSEIANIAWEQIDLTEKTIQLWRSKVSNESTLFMSDRVAVVLDRRKLGQSSPFVFSNKKGGPRGYQSPALRRAMNRANLQDCTIHTFRHTHASRLIQLGMSIYEVQKILGHSDIRTTMRYAHLEETEVTGRARDLINALNKDDKILLVQ